MDKLSHYSVMLQESIDMLNINPDGIYVDCTLGGGGHSEKILEHLVNGHLYAIEQDDLAIELASKRLLKYQDKLTIIKSNFENIKEELEALNVVKVDGIIYDLGVSSFQFDIPERGFSYRFDSRLDMRMDQDSPLSAYEVVNNYSEKELKRILYEYGEEKFAPQIVRNIVKERINKPIETTFELVEIIKKSLPAAVRRKSSHPAKQTFQALRIEVNQELTVLENSLRKSLDLLNPNGRIVVITFHSLEDRIVKRLFKENTTLNLPPDLPFIPEGYEVKYELLNNKVIIPTQSELDDNNRSHSAKLRGIMKKS